MTWITTMLLLCLGAPGFALHWREAALWAAVFVLIGGGYLAQWIFCDRLADWSLSIYQHYPSWYRKTSRWLTRGASESKGFAMGFYRVTGITVAAIVLVIGGLIVWNTSTGSFK